MRFGPAKRDWIVITGPDDGHQVQLAILPTDLPSGPGRGATAGWYLLITVILRSSRGDYRDS
jgi:hypothetical protein